jgi:hypothetical protein
LLKCKHPYGGFFMGVPPIDRWDFPVRTSATVMSSSPHEPNMSAFRNTYPSSMHVRNTDSSSYMLIQPARSDT